MSLVTATYADISYAEQLLVFAIGLHKDGSRHAAGALDDALEAVRDAEKTALEAVNTLEETC